MKNYYQNDHEAIEENFVAQLTVAVSQDGEFIFGCDWEPNETGIRSVASIFYGITHEQLTDQVLKELKSQCVLEDKQDDFLAIIELIGALIKKDDNSRGDSDQSVAVPPRNVFKM
mgnify:CR=1 FL=1|tara:strand:+ start:4437 stop:4781 length:345 start_codon:yes stop_codon:yes gene_type:complete